MAEQKARVAEARQRGSSEGSNAAGEGEEAAPVRKAWREDVEDAESKGQAANAHVRIMTLCVSCVSCVYLYNGVFTYHVCPRLVGSVDYWASCIIIICSRTPCLQLQTRLVKRRSRKCTDVTRGQSQFEFSCRQASRWPEDPCWCPWPPAIKSTQPGLVPGKRLRIAHASLSCNFGPAQLATGYTHQLAHCMPTANSRVCGLSVFIIR